MDTLSWFLFESIIALGIVLALVNFGLLVYWRRGNSARPLLIALLVSVIMLAMQSVVVTPREHAKHILKVIEDDLVESSVEQISQVLARDFEALGLGRTEFLQFVKARYGVLELIWVQRTGFEVEDRTKDTLTAKLSYYADVRARDYTGGFPSTWRAKFIKRDGTWWLLTAEAIRPSWSEIRSAR